MGKILQVIKKDSDFENGKVKINLYDTSFKTLSKLMDSVPGQTVQNAATGQKVGYQVFRNLNSLQYAERVKLERFTSQYNSWVNTSKSKVSNLINFNYIFTSLTQNYSNAIVKDSKLDMLLLEKIVNPEKEIYDFIIKANDHMQSNLSKLREWSKKRRYGSCVNHYISREFEMKERSSWIITQRPGNNVGVSIGGSPHDKNRITFYNLQNLPVGSTATCKLTGLYDRGEPGGGNSTRFTGEAVFSVKREPLFSGDKEGYFRVTSVTWRGGTNNGTDGTNGTDYYTSKNTPSPHFNTSNVNLKFLKSRVLI